MPQPHTHTKTSIIRVVDIQDIFECSERQAKRILRDTRIKLGKNPNVNGHKGGDPVTRDQFYHAQGLNPPERK